jgi:hypothetical protein
MGLKYRFPLNSRFIAAFVMVAVIALGAAFALVSPLWRSGGATANNVPGNSSK